MATFKIILSNSVAIKAPPPSSPPEEDDDNTADEPIQEE